MNTTAHNFSEHCSEVELLQAEIDFLKGEKMDLLDVIRLQIDFLMHGTRELESAESIRLRAAKALKRLDSIHGLNDSLGLKIKSGLKGYLLEIRKVK